MKSVREDMAASGQRYTSAGLALGLTVLLIVVLRLVAWGQAEFLGDVSDRTLAVFKIGGAAIGECLVILLSVPLFRRLKVQLLENPVVEHGRLRGWVVAGVIWLLWALPMIVRPPQNVPVLELSGFNVLGSMLAGPGAGVAEELIFRGLLMSLLAWGGWGMGLRVVMTSLLFGLAHAGWGLLSGGLAVGLIATAGTSVLGVVLGVVYVLSGRRLLPALVLHAAINLVIEPWLVLGAIRGTLMTPGG